MSKKAVLVDVVIRTRIVVDEEATDDEIYQTAYPRLLDNLETSGAENMEYEDDTECPYQPDLDSIWD